MLAAMMPACAAVQTSRRDRRERYRDRGNAASPKIARLSWPAVTSVAKWPNLLVRRRAMMGDARHRRAVEICTVAVVSVAVAAALASMDDTHHQQRQRNRHSAALVARLRHCPRSRRRHSS